MFPAVSCTMFGGEEGRLAALVQVGPGSHQQHRSDLHVRQLPQTLLSVPDHGLHRVQLLCYHGDLGLQTRTRKERTSQRM